MNPLDIVLIVVLAIIIGLAVRATIKRRRNGGCSCGSGNGCSGCSGDCSCCSRKTTNKNQLND